MERNGRPAWDHFFVFFLRGKSTNQLSNLAILFVWYLISINLLIFMWLTKYYIQYWIYILKYNLNVKPSRETFTPSRETFTGGREGFTAPLMTCLSVKSLVICFVCVPHLSPLLHSFFVSKCDHFFPKKQKHTYCLAILIVCFDTLTYDIFFHYQGHGINQIFK